MISLRNISVCGQLQSDFTGPADGCLPREIWDTKVKPKHPKALALMRAGTQVGQDPLSGEVLEFLVEHEPIKPLKCTVPHFVCAGFQDPLGGLFIWEVVFW